MRLELAHRSRPCVGETLNGDAVWTGQWIHRPAFAVFDASGHGPEAHDALLAFLGKYGMRCPGEIDVTTILIGSARGAGA